MEATSLPEEKDKGLNLMKVANNLAYYKYSNNHDHKKVYTTGSRTLVFDQ
jgi:hypothetical protein